MKKTSLILVTILSIFVVGVMAQKQKKPIQKKSSNPTINISTILKDAEGNIISREEFFEVVFTEQLNFVKGARYYDQVVENGKVIEAKLKRSSREGQSPPPFSVKTLDGKPINSKDLLGKVVVLNFWYVACKGCIAEMPKLNEVVRKFNNENVIFLGVTYDSATLVNKFLARIPFGYQIIPDEKKLLDSFNFIAYPRNIIIGKDGKIVYWRAAIIAWEKFEKVIESELKK